MRSSILTIVAVVFFGVVATDESVQGQQHQGNRENPHNRRGAAGASSHKDDRRPTHRAEGPGQMDPNSSSNKRKGPKAPAPKSKPPKVVYAWYDKNKGQLSPAQDAAYNKLLSNKLLAPEDRQSLSNLLASSTLKIPDEVSKFLQQGLERGLQDRRKLKIRNLTNERVKIWVQYYTLNDKDKWAWYPADPKSPQPGKPTKISCYFNPGEQDYLLDDDWQVNASRVRIWAQSNTRQWPKYQDIDLWLVKEVNGERYYYAEEMGTFVFPIR